MTDHYIEAPDLAVAWLRAAAEVVAAPGAEVGPLVVSITGFDAFGVPTEDVSIRAALDRLLNDTGRQSNETVANTIFPRSLWNPARPRAELFERYHRIQTRLRDASAKNRRGTYFGRMISGGSPGQENQLDYILNSFARPSMRRSALQLSVFDARLDHTRAAQLGFPCLQHVSFAPLDDGLAVNAFYATQYIAERAYGNYLGLCRLGAFVAHELHLPMTRVTCYSGIMMRDASKRTLRPITGLLP